MKGAQLQYSMCTVSSFCTITWDQCLSSESYFQCGSNGGMTVHYMQYTGVDLPNSSFDALVPLSSVLWNESVLGCDGKTRHMTE